jgi:hypothetical protein
MTHEHRVSEDNTTIKEWEHPNGEPGIVVALTLTTEELAEMWDIDLHPEAVNTPTIMPLKHNADNATNFESYHLDDDGETVVIVQTDAQFDEVQSRLQQML